MKAIACILEKNDTLLVLRVAKNDIKDPGAGCIASLIRANKALEDLDLSMNGFTSGAAEQLSEAFKSNCTLQYVDLSDNDIDDQGATLLSSGVEGMKSLAEFGLNRITAKEAGERALKDAAWRNAKQFKKSPPKIRLGPGGLDELSDAE